MPNLLDADGKVAEVTIWWRPLPSAVEMQGHIAHVVGTQPLGTAHERGVTIMDALVPCL
jgi:hypothetical protein